MSKETDPNKKHYFKSADHNDFIYSLELHCQAKINSPVTAWEKGASEHEAEQFQILAYFPNRKMIKLKPVGKIATQIVGSKSTGRSILIKIPIDEKTHFFTGGTLEYVPEDLTYLLKINQDIYKSQARKGHRLNASKAVPIQFKIDDQVFDALDISIGGTSIAVDEYDLYRFKKGSQFVDCILRFDRKNYYIPEAKVVIVEPLPLENNQSIRGRFKIGIAFHNMNQKILDELYVKISIETRGEEMKNKFDNILTKKSAS